MWFKDHRACQAITANYLYQRKCDLLLTSCSHHGEVRINIFAVACQIPLTLGQSLDNGHRESTWSAPWPAVEKQSLKNHCLRVR